MNFSGLLTSVGSIGPFSARIFLPALITALLLRFGAHVPLMDRLGLLPHAQYSSWFTSNACIAMLAALSVVEMLAQKNPEARRVLNEIDIYVKPVAAGLCAMGVLSVTDVRTVGLFANHTASVLNDISPLIAAAGTFGVARIRRDVVGLILDHIEGTHLDRLLSWGEDGLVIVGVFAWVLFPILMLFLIGLGTLVLARWRRKLRKIEEQSRVPCAKCGASIYPSAMACPACRTPVSQPMAVGFLGLSKPEPDPDLVHHPLRLVEKKRCAFCAGHIKHAAIGQKCPDCGTIVIPDDPFAERYANYIIASRLPTVLTVSFLIGLVPLLGLIIGSIYYRMELVLPFNEYLPMGRRFTLRIGLRILFFLLAIFQLIPVAGAAVVPIMALLTYGAYRASFRSYVASLHAGEVLPGAAAMPAV